MEQSPQPPKFGNWESGENVHYTAYFDNARKGRKGAKLNPNDPQDSSEPESRSAGSPLHSKAGAGKAATESSEQRHGGAGSGSSIAEHERPKGADTLKAKDERRLSQEEGDLRRPNDSPMRHEAATRKTTSDSPHHRHVSSSAGDNPRRIGRQGAGSDRSIEHSPLHPQSHGRIAGKGGAVSSPSWERKGSSEGSHGLPPSTPGKSRLRSVTRGDDTPDHGLAVPKFGDWDDNDPSSAEGYTAIFELVRDEKQTGADKVPVAPAEPSHSNGQRRDRYYNSEWCGCFSWCRR